MMMMIIITAIKIVFITAATKIVILTTKIVITITPLCRSYHAVMRPP